MAQYVYTMRRVGKVVPPKRVILEDISLSFFPGAKIGVLGMNGAGKSSLLRIMAGVDRDFIGEAVPMPDMKIGYLPQEPQLDPGKDVRGNVEEGVADTLALIRYRVPLETAEGVVIEERYWSATHTPLLDKRAEVAFILQHTVDVTELQRL